MTRSSFRSLRSLHLSSAVLFPFLHPQRQRRLRRWPAAAPPERAQPCAGEQHCSGDQRSAEWELCAVRCWPVPCGIETLFRWFQWWFLPLVFFVVSQFRRLFVWIIVGVAASLVSGLSHLHFVCGNPMSMCKILLPAQANRLTGLIGPRWEPLGAVSFRRWPWTPGAASPGISQGKEAQSRLGPGLGQQDAIDDQCRAHALLCGHCGFDLRSLDPGSVPDNSCVFFGWLEVSGAKCGL